MPDKSGSHFPKLVTVRQCYCRLLKSARCAILQKSEPKSRLTLAVSTSHFPHTFDCLSTRMPSERHPFFSLSLENKENKLQINITSLTCCKCFPKTCTSVRAGGRSFRTQLRDAPVSCSLHQRLPGQGIICIFYMYLLLRLPGRCIICIFFQLYPSLFLRFTVVHCFHIVFAAWKCHRTSLNMTTVNLRMKWGRKSNLLSWENWHCLRNHWIIIG